MSYEAKTFSLQCRGRNEVREEVLKEPVAVELTVSCRDARTISLSVKCPHNTGGHGQRCKASHPAIDKVGDGIQCPYAVDLPYAFDSRA